MRTIGFLTAKNVLLLWMLILDSDHLSMSQKFVSEKSEEDSEASKFTEPVVNTAYNIYIILIASRLLINMFAFFWPQVCKITFYIEIFITLMCQLNER